MVYIAVALIVAFLLYLLLRDTMNKLQYVQTFRIYWITRDNASGGPFVTKGFMRQTAAPWWRGSGIQFTLGKYCFQIGVLTDKGSDLLDQVGGREMHESPKEIRGWS